MDIDHIFIFTDHKGLMAEKLIAFGCTEGSSRMHHGQGTSNRKFYFENFFLELLWVHDEEEIKSDTILPTGLYERANFKNTNFSPFGLCLVNNDQSDPVFKNSYLYQPDYFPVGMKIEILKNEDHPTLPWTFRLPFKGFAKNESEPKNHKNGIRNLTEVIFEFVDEANNDFLKNFTNEPQIQFEKTSRNWLTLVFDDAKNNKTKDFEKLKLTITY